MGPAPIEYESIGHHDVIPSVKTVNARSRGASTTTLRRTATPACCCSTIALLLLLGCIAKGRERLVPEGVEVGPQVGQCLRVHLVEAAGADLAVGHQPGVLQDLEVLRDRGAADRELAGELADRPGPRDEALEDRLPRGVAQRGHRCSYVRHGLPVAQTD